MLQDNLKNQRDSVKNGLDTRRTGHVILHWEFLNENFIALSSRVLSFLRKYNEFFVLVFPKSLKFVRVSHNEH